MTSSGGGNTVKRRSSQPNAKQKTVKTEVLYRPAMIIVDRKVVLEVVHAELAMAEAMHLAYHQLVHLGADLNQLLHSVLRVVLCGSQNNG